MYGEAVISIPQQSIPDEEHEDSDAEPAPQAAADSAAEGAPAPGGDLPRAYSSFYRESPRPAAQPDAPGPHSSFYRDSPLPWQASKARAGPSQHSSAEPTYNTRAASGRASSEGASSLQHDSPMRFHDSAHMEGPVQGLPEKLQLGPGGASDDDLPGGLKPIDSWHISAGDKDGRGMHITFQARVPSLWQSHSGKLCFTSGLSNSEHDQCLP